MSLYGHTDIIAGSEAFRDVIRSLMTDTELTKMNTGNVAVTIMITYDYARKDVI